MATIIQVPIQTEGTKNAMVLGNEDFVRPLAFGSDWTSVRIGLLYGARADGTNNMLNTGLVFGLCHGAAAAWGSSSTGHFVGSDISGNNATYYTWTYQANSGNPVFLATLPCLVKKVASTVSITNIGTNSWYSCVAGQGTLRRKGLALCDITKGSPNFTVTSYSMSLAQCSVDYTFANFVEAMETAALNATALGYQQGTVSVSEGTDGLLDSLDVFWPRVGANLLEIYDVMVSRLS